MGGILNELLSWLLKTLVYDMILMPLFENLNDMVSNDTIFNALNVDMFFEAMRSIGLALFALIISWQALKSMFGFAGLEVEDPAKLIFKSIIMGVALGWSKDIMMFGINLSNGIVSLLLGDVYEGSGAFSFSGGGMSDSFLGLSIRNDTILEMLLGFIINLIIIFKVVGIYIRMIERIVLNGFLIIGAPLAFAAGVSQPTKGFFQGFIKVYIGNQILIVLQNLGIVILMTFMSQFSPVEGSSLLNAFIALAIVKVIAKLEDIVRDMSIGVGVGRDMGSAIQQVQSVVHGGTMVVNTIKSAK